MYYLQRPRDQVFIVTRLYCKKSPEDLEFEPELSHPSIMKLCQPAINGICFESGAAKAAKGEERALPFICCAQDTVAL